MFEKPMPKSDRVVFRSRIVVFLIGFFVAFFAFGINPALAHNAFDSSSPFDGEIVANSPTQWTITFTKSVPLDSFSGEVINGDGIRTQLTSPTHGATDNIVVVALPTSLIGEITARWKLVSSDGHVVSGRVAFSVNATTTTTIAVPPTTTLVVNPEVASPQVSSTTASPPPSCRRRRPLIVFIIIVQDGRAAVCSDARASTMVLWIGRCGGCGEAGERRRGGRMVDGVVMERLREGRRLRTIGGGGGGRRVER